MRSPNHQRKQTASNRNAKHNDANNDPIQTDETQKTMIAKQSSVMPQNMGNDRSEKKKKKKKHHI